MYDFLSNIGLSDIHMIYLYIVLTFLMGLLTVIFVNRLYRNIGK